MRVYRRHSINIKGSADRRHGVRRSNNLPQTHSSHRAGFSSNTASMKKRSKCSQRQSPLTIKTSDAAAQGVVEGNIATINFNLRHFEESIVWFQRAAETFERAGNARNQAFSLRGVGMCRSKQGKV